MMLVEFPSNFLVSGWTGFEEVKNSFISFKSNSLFYLLCDWLIKFGALSVWDSLTHPVVITAFCYLISARRSLGAS